MRTVEVIGKSSEEAISQALQELNTTRDRVEVDIFEDTSKGFFGFILEVKM